MKHLRVIVASALCVLALTGCGRMALKKNLIAFRESQIVFPADLTKIEGADFSTFSPMDEVWKLVVFADSTHCSSCLLGKLEAYKDILNSLSEKGPVLLMVIISPSISEQKRILADIQYQTYSFDVYLDTCGMFASLNPLVAKDPRFNVFLTDRKNHPLVVGDPVLNPKIFDLMFESMKNNH